MSERQREREFTARYSLRFDYDPMGRVGRKTLGWAGTEFLLDSSYDELGRLAQLEYPDGTILRYEREGAYLRAVCEVSGAGDDCAHPEAIPYVAHVAYDELG